MHAAVHVELIPPQSPTPQISVSTTSIVEATTASARTSATMPPTSTVAGTTTTTTATTTTTVMTAAESTDSQKPYQCQHCGRRFTRPHEKVKHERIHTGEKPHACEVDGHLCNEILRSVKRSHFFNIESYETINFHCTFRISKIFSNIIYFAST